MACVDLRSPIILFFVAMAKPMTIPTIYWMLAGVASASAVIAVQELPVPQQWTVLALLAAVLGGVYLLLRSVGSRLVNAIEANTSTVGKLVGELHVLVHQNAERNRDDLESREGHVANLKNAIEEIPDEVVRRIREKS